MKIVLLADHRKNELLLNFCIAYSKILEKHELISLFHTATLLSQTTELNLDGIPTDITGGLDQLAARATYNEIDAVIYLKDTQLDTYMSSDPLMQACDANIIPYAGNIASAELLVLAIDRGDLDWRQLLH